MSDRSSAPAGNAFVSLVRDGRRIEVIRRGAQLTVRADGRALAESDARVIADHGLDDGERLIECIARDGTEFLSYTFTFVVWPRTVSHTARMLDQLRDAA